MATKLKFNDILTKLSYVFSKDMYLYEYKYCIGGPESEDLNEGQIICELDNEVVDILKNEFPESGNIYFIDIKKAKKDPENFINKKIDDMTKYRIKKIYTEFTSNVSNTNKWNTLKLSESDINDIFIERNLHWLFDKSSDEVNIQVAKSTFPLLSEKNINDTVITYFTIKPNEESDIATIVFNYNIDFLTINELIMYLDISATEK